MAKLYLIPTSLANPILCHSLLTEQLALIQHVKHFIVETAKIGRQHLKCLNLDTQLQELDIQELNKHSGDLSRLIAPLLTGNDVGIISDCGMPAIADPGASLIAMAHYNHIQVVPLVGPSSLLLALMASGCNGQSFAFAGYLPVEATAKKNILQKLASKIINDNQTQLVIETPFRNQQLFEFLLKHLNSEIRLCVAINLMQNDQQVLSFSVTDWHKQAVLPLLHKQEVVFVIGRDIQNG